MFDLFYMLSVLTFAVNWCYIDKTDLCFGVKLLRHCSLTINGSKEKKTQSHSMTHSFGHVFRLHSAIGGRMRSDVMPVTRSAWPV